MLDIEWELARQSLVHELTPKYIQETLPRQKM